MRYRRTTTTTRRQPLIDLKSFDALAIPSSTMHNSAMRSESHWPGGPPPPPPPIAASHRKTPLGGWKKDLKDRLTGAVVVSILVTGLMLLSGTGLLRTRPGSTASVIDPDGLWAGILVVGAPLMWAFGQVKFSRVDKGFRTHGLPSLMLVSTGLAAMLQILLMLTWPLVADDSLAGHAVLTQYHANPLAFCLVAVFVIALYAWTTVAMLGFAGKGAGTSALGTVGWLIIAGVGAWQGTVMFENPATIGSFWVWAGIALLGIVLVPIIAAARKS